MLVLVVLTLAQLAVFMRVIGRSWAYPPATFAAVWTVLLCWYAMAGTAFYSLSPHALAIFLIGALAFAAGGLFATLAGGRRERSPTADPMPLSLAFLGIAALLPAYLAALSAIAGGSLLAAGALLQIRHQTVGPLFAGTVLSVFSEMWFTNVNFLGKLITILVFVRGAGALRRLGTKGRREAVERAPRHDAEART